MPKQTFKCGYCKAEVKEGAKECPKCGESFNKSVKNKGCTCNDKELFKRTSKIFFKYDLILLVIFLIIIVTYNHVRNININLFVLTPILIIAWLLFPLCLIKLEMMRRCKEHRYISVIIFIIFVLIMLYLYWRLIMSKLS